MVIKQIMVGWVVGKWERLQWGARQLMDTLTLWLRGYFHGCRICQNSSDSILGICDAYCMSIITQQSSF